MGATTPYYLSLGSVEITLRETKFGFIYALSTLERRYINIAVWILRKITLVYIDHVSSTHLAWVCSISCPNTSRFWHSFLGDVAGQSFNRCWYGPIKGRLFTIPIHSNALTLEYATLHNPRAGSLITFAQFILVALFGLRKRFTNVARKPDEKGPSTLLSSVHFIQRIKGIRFKPLAVPLRRWTFQVVLFLGISLLNNYAFKYRVPMTVHIIFRSGGPVVNMIIGYFQMNKRYPKLQVLSVILVSAGIAACTASSAKTVKAPVTATSSSMLQSNTNLSNPAHGSFLIEYAIGISMLALALILSQYLGFSQEETNKLYGRGHWEEGMFFRHFLAIPMFLFLRNDLVEQIRLANASEPISIAELVNASFTMPANFIACNAGTQCNISPPSLSSKRWPTRLPELPLLPFSSLTIPYFWIPLLLNTLTQIVCASGVNRLTVQVDSLAVTLILIMRKAVSLIISIVLVGRSRGNVWLWGGSATVLIGSVLYAYCDEKARRLGRSRKGTKLE